MANANTSWLSLKSLDPATAAELRALHQLDTRWNWVCLLYPLLWLGSIVLMELYPYGWVRAFGVVVIGVSIQAMGILVHEALHANLFRNGRLDRWAAFLLGIPAFLSGGAYRLSHLHHHRYTRTGKDPDEISHLVNTPGQYRVLFFSWFLIGTPLYLSLIVPRKALSLASPAERRQVLMEYTAMLTVYALVFISALAAGLGWELLWYWLLPTMVAIALGNVRALAEHLGTGFDTVFTRTRTTTSNFLVSFLMLNLNYHLEHHLLPGIPWYNLQKAHHLLLPVYAGHAVAIERSYIAGVMRALRSGPFNEFQERVQESGGVNT